jgi:hypothetical protein
MRCELASVLQYPREGKHYCDAGHKDEKGQDKIVEAQSLPLHMLELVSDDGAGCVQDRALAGRHFGERLCGTVRADDPEHSKAAQGIDRGHPRSRERPCLDDIKLVPA